MPPKMILVMCGLPGAGKSYWASRLHSSAISRKGGETRFDDDVRHVDFDAVEAGLLREGSGKDNSNRIDTWHSARVMALEQAQDILLEEVAERHRVVVVLDDNMYYASMRREAYQLAARYGVGYGCLHVATPLDVALVQNKSRPAGRSVTEEVIRRMHTKLQVPDPNTRSWEANTVAIGNITTLETQDNEAETLRKIWTVIERGYKTPATIVEVSSAEEKVAKEEARQRTRGSLLHATELMLRKIIGTAMQLVAAGDGLFNVKPSSFGPRFSVAKAAVMREVGKGNAQSFTQDRILQQADAKNILVGKLFIAMREKGREEETAALLELERQTLAKLVNM